MSDEVKMPNGREIRQEALSEVDASGHITTDDHAGNSRHAVKAHIHIVSHSTPPFIAVIDERHLTQDADRDKRSQSRIAKLK
jgi:hypothetical protein